MTCRADGFKASRAARFATAGAIVLLLGGTATSADEFLALPGLWRTTYVVRGADPQSGTVPAESKVRWHCEDEAADPWLAFAQLQDAPEASCSRPLLERTRTSLKWRVECPASTSEGSVVFDSPLHYKGWVKLSGTLRSNSIQSVTVIEGERRAACTSPAD